MTEIPDEDDVSEMVEEVWNGRDSWYGGDVVVARSLTHEGDAILLFRPLRSPVPASATAGWTWSYPSNCWEWILEGEARDGQPG